MEIGNSIEGSEVVMADKKKRNYADEYAKHHSSEKAKKDRAARNKARRKAIADGKVKKGDKSTDIDHVKPLRSGGSKSTSNTRKRSASANRSDNGHVKGEKHKRHKK